MTEEFQDLKKTDYHTRVNPPGNPSQIFLFSCCKNSCCKKSCDDIHSTFQKRKKGAAPPPFRTPCKGASPLDPIMLNLLPSHYHHRNIYRNNIFDKAGKFFLDNN
ncbi:hypothetical protein [Candidatus Magnetobacterium casense]|uniref:Uncharacterized protein n=1 Tax=Candidatus Magnetobacterium casense TaxID=1455061 RepID=A0ABS6RW74_9BACT|nr:hypothetical protein [Candidatus Magnetobacterium casensis]MBV6340841.1 hypothetical protein [Candidatus Magnetobacterium casensis]